MKKIVIVSRHPATIEYLEEFVKNQGCEPVLIDGNAGRYDVNDQIVIGNLPLHLAHICARYIAVEFETFPPRGEEVSAEELIDVYGLSLSEYEVKWKTKKIVFDPPKSEWKLEEDVKDMIRSEGLDYARFNSGNSPYNPFDLVAFTRSEKYNGLGRRKWSVQIMDTTVKTEDPATAYKGRHGSGRLIICTECSDGLEIVPSNNSDIAIELADGTCLGRKDQPKLADL